MPPADLPLPVAIMAEVDRVARRPLWPTFEPRQTPVAIVHEAQTFLFRHPAPPPGFQPWPGFPGRTERCAVSVFQGDHPALRANTSLLLEGVPTAVLIVETPSRQSTRELAALVIHEAFHVYQRAHHPAWQGNEAELFLYPFQDAPALHLRRLETAALRRALASRRLDELAHHAGTAIALRQERFARLLPGAVAYERGSELNEGLAQYVQDKASGRAAGSPLLALPAQDFAVEEVRRRCYATGRAMASLLDRLSDAWPRQLEDGAAPSLDELLARVLPSTAAGGEAVSAAVRRAELARAEREVETLLVQRAAARSAYLGRAGWTLVVRAAESAPLWPQAFDPMNVRHLGYGEVMHTRWLKLASHCGTLEVLGRAALTAAAGSHPLFGGVRTLTLTGFEAEPVVAWREDELRVSAAGFRAQLRGALLRRDGQRLCLNLRPQPAAPDR
jgi:hypothetical protein